MSDHCVLDYANQPPVFRCLGCGVTREVQLPMPVTELAKLSAVFACGHRNCQPRQKRQEPG